MSIDDVCLAFDGCGGEARCTIAKVSKRAVELLIVERLDTNRELSQQVNFAVALPKGDRQKTLVDFLVQLGVHTLQPLITKRGVAQPVESALARLRRSVVESSKQCGRNQLMQVLEPVELAQLLNQTSADTSNRPALVGGGQVRDCNEKSPERSLQIFAHPYGDATPLNQLQSDAKLAKSVTVLIGPEGGFTEEEAQALRTAGWTAVSLGLRILRVEVAATHIASWLAEQS
jgi:16S rRNA (uracil1498-N3)-methyltransferase